MAAVARIPVVSGFGAGGSTNVEYRALFLAILAHQLQHSWWIACTAPTVHQKATPDPLPGVTPTDLPSALTFVNSLHACLLVHMAEVGTATVNGAHQAADTTNHTTLAAVGSAVDLATANTRANACQASLNAHLTAVGVHFLADPTPADTTPTATDLASLLTLLGALHTYALAHFGRASLQLTILTLADPGVPGVVSTIPPPASFAVQASGTPEPSRPALNFLGAGVTVSDNPGNGSTDVTVAGGGGSPVNQGGYTCAPSVVVKNWVYASSGAALLATATDPAKRAMGVVVAKADATHCTVQYFGEAGVFSSLAPDTDFYLSDTPGEMTATLPTDEVQFLCRSRSASTVIVQPQPLTEVIHP